MQYSSIIKGDSTYIIQTNIDLSNIVYVNNIYLSFYQAEIDLEHLTDSIYDAESDLYYKKGTQITSFKNFTYDNPSGYLSVETRNENKNIYELQIINQDYSLLGIQLYKQNIQISNQQKIYQFEQIFPDIINHVDEPYVLNCKIKEESVSISLLQNPKDTIQYKLIPTFLEKNSIYKITLQIWKIFIGETSQVSFDINFKTFGSELTSNSYNTYSNNIIYTNNKMSDIGNVNSILDTSTLNYKFIPTTINSDGIIVKQTDEFNEEIFLSVNTHQTILELYILQYLNEYSDFFKLIDEININNTTFSSKKIKRILLEYSKLMHSSIKGNVDGIYKLLDIFCNSTDYYLISVEENASKNFIYRVTCTAPEEYWNVIKTICHPLSWKCEYIQIDITSIIPNCFYTDIPFNLNSKGIATSYLDYYNNYKYILNISILQLNNTSNRFDMNKFNYKYNSYFVEQIFDVCQDETFLQQISNTDYLTINTVQDANCIKVIYSYQENSLLDYYSFSIYYNNQLISSKIESVANGYMLIPTTYTDFTIQLSVLFDDFNELIITKSVSI